MELRQVLDQRPTVTPQLILATRLLGLSSPELEQAITRELAENPVLELVETRRCPACGRAMVNDSCPRCRRAVLGPEGQEPSRLTTPVGDAPYSGYDASDEGDDLSWLASTTTLSDHLLRQVRLSLPECDWLIAVCLVESLDDHGFLDCDLDDLASSLGVERARVDGVVSAFQELDPVGIAATDARECLLIQLDHLDRQGVEQPLARALVRDHWETLGRRSSAEIAEAVGTTEEQALVALQFIKSNLNPFPAHAYWADVRSLPPQSEAAYPRPDVIISADVSSERFEIELPEADEYRLRISASVLKALESPDAISDAGRGWDWWTAYHVRARLFIKSVEQRWRTLRCLMDHLVEAQRDFLIHGERHLKPLTRAQLAEIMGVHESTVSRAVTGKYVQLPSGRVVPLSRLFDRSAPVKELIKELVAQEGEPLSDREIAERLAEQGYRIARRTVAKYRNALSILPSTLR
jgi:RNA polymerase sigma-54 factor